MALRKKAASSGKGGSQSIRPPSVQLNLFDYALRNFKLTNSAASRTKTQRKLGPSEKLEGQEGKKRAADARGAEGIIEVEYAASQDAEDRFSEVIRVLLDPPKRAD